jgi:iron-sulfur cluster assembly protein
MDIPRFQVTAAAARHVLAQAAASDAAGLALRVAARQEADGSIAYGMGFDEVAPDDEPLGVEGLTVVVAAGCEPLLDGTVLDFVELSPGAFHFVFIPPQPATGAAAPACGSGGCSGCGGA